MRWRPMRSPLIFLGFQWQLPSRQLAQTNPKKSYGFRCGGRKRRNPPRPVLTTGTLVFPGIIGRNKMGSGLQGDASINFPPVTVKRGGGGRGGAKAGNRGFFFLCGHPFLNLGRTVRCLYGTQPVAHPAFFDPRFPTKIVKCSAGSNRHYYRATISPRLPERARLAPHAMTSIDLRRESNKRRRRRKENCISELI